MLYLLSRWWFLNVQCLLLSFYINFSEMYRMSKGFFIKLILLFEKCTQNSLSKNIFDCILLLLRDISLIIWTTSKKVAIFFNFIVFQKRSKLFYAFYVMVLKGIIYLNYAWSGNIWLKKIVYIFTGLTTRPLSCAHTYQIVISSFSSMTVLCAFRGHTWWKFAHLFSLICLITSKNQQ